MEIPTLDEKAYFQTWSDRQNLKFPRKKRSFTLDNGLEALLIQDPRTKKAAVAVDVGIGEASDPLEHSGLAHYLEHMLFVSTTKYPELNGFDKFTADNNGSSNAFTDTYHTNYFFDVNAAALHEALDRFGQFFICPTFDPTQLARELEAVDSEYQKNVQQDVWGLNHILNSLGNPLHPKFYDFQGNKSTLSGVTQENIREFFQNHYSSHLMKLVIIAPNDLSEVEGWVRSIFSLVKNNSNAKTVNKNASFFPTEHLPRLVIYKGVEAKQTLSLEFELPAFDAFKYSSPNTLVSQLISSDRPGMLYDRLMKKGWASQVATRQEDLGSSQLLGVDFQLTDLGLIHWKDVIFDFYQAIALLRKTGVPRYIYEELKLQGELQFIHSSPANHMDRVSIIAGRLQDWPSDEVEGLENLTVRYAPESFLSVLGSVRPEKMQVVLTDHHLLDGLKDPFYQVQYQVTPLSSEDIERWSNATLNPELVFPAPNPFLPTDFSLRGSPDLSPVLLEGPGRRLWVQTDHEFEIPKVDLTINTLSGRAFTRREQALRILYLESVNLAVRPVLSQASSFGYNFTGDLSKTGYLFRLGGYSDGFEKFFQVLVKTLDLSDVTGAEFQAIQEDILNEIEDELTQEPYGIAHSRFKSLIEGALTLADIKDELASATLEEVTTFAREFWTRPLLLHSAAFGNVTHEEAQAFLNYFQKTVNNRIFLEKESVAFQEFVALEKSRALVHETRVKDQNHGVEHYLSFGKTTTTKQMAMNALELLMSNQFFKDLRTEGEIGYIASLRSYSNAGQCGVGVLVQSSWPVEKIDAACLGWLAKMPQKLAGVSDENFAQIRASLLEEIQKPHFTFEQKVSSMLSGVFEHRERFDWKEDAIQLLKKLERTELVDFVSHQIDPVRRRLLSVYAIGAAGGETRKREQINTEEFATSSRKYKVPRFR